MTSWWTRLAAVFAIALGVAVLPGCGGESKDKAKSDDSHKDHKHEKDKDHKDHKH